MFIWTAEYIVGHVMLALQAVLISRRGVDIKEGSARCLRK